MAAVMDMGNTVIMVVVWAIINIITDITAVWDTLIIQAEDMDTICLTIQAITIINITDMAEATDSHITAGKDSSGAKDGVKDNQVTEAFHLKVAIRIPMRNLPQIHHNIQTHITNINRVKHTGLSNLCVFFVKFIQINFTLSRVKTFNKLIKYLERNFSHERALDN